MTQFMLCNVPDCMHSGTVADRGGLHDKHTQVYDETGLKFIIEFI